MFLGQKVRVQFGLFPLKIYYFKINYVKNTILHSTIDKNYNRNKIIKIIARLLRNVMLYRGHLGLAQIKSESPIIKVQVK